MPGRPCCRFINSGGALHHRSRRSRPSNRMQTKAHFGVQCSVAILAGVSDALRSVAKCPQHLCMSDYHACTYNDIGMHWKCFHCVHSERSPLISSKTALAFVVEYVFLSVPGRWRWPRDTRAIIIIIRLQWPMRCRHETMAEYRPMCWWPNRGGHSLAPSLSSPLHPCRAVPFRGCLCVSGARGTKHMHTHTHTPGKTALERTTIANTRGHIRKKYY